MTSTQMIDLVAGWLDKYPIVSLEDALSEDDWEKLAKAPNGPRFAGFDARRRFFLCTNPERIRRAINEGCANALLLKVNQIGSLTEAARL